MLLMVSSLKGINLPLYYSGANRCEMVLAVNHIRAIADCRCAGEAIVPVIMPVGLTYKVV